MFRIERPTITITANKIRLAVVLALAAASLLYLAIMMRAQTSQIGERVSATVSTSDDVIDNGSFDLASWYCASMPIATKCPGAQPAPRAGMIEGVAHGSVTLQRADNLGNQITLAPNN